MLTSSVFALAGGRAGGSISCWEVSLVQEWDPVGGGQHRARRLVRKATKGLSGVSVTCLLSRLGTRPCSPCVYTGGGGRGGGPF